jgi:hypothetical protein
MSDDHEASYNIVRSSPAACAVRAVDAIITGFRFKALALTRVKSLTSSLPALRPMRFVPRRLLVFLQRSNGCTLQAARAYEKHRAAHGKPTDHATAKELVYDMFSTRRNEFLLIVHVVLLQAVPSLIGSSRPRV